MLSTPLFRPGDCVHARQDLQYMFDYFMLHSGQWVPLTQMRHYAISNNTGVYVFPCHDNELYESHGYYVTDEMFVEGIRVMQYLIRE